MNDFKNITIALHKKYIKNWAESLREEMKNGMLFGEPIDINDPDFLIVSAYMLGRMDNAHCGTRIHYFDEREDDYEVH